MLDPDHPSRRLRRTLWATAGFLVGFAILLAIVVFGYLIPATERWRTADAAHRHAMAAYSALLMVILLITLGVGLFLTFRVHRFFFPKLGDATKTRLPTDAWTEAAKRRRTPTAQQLEESADDELD